MVCVPLATVKLVEPLLTLVLLPAPPASTTGLLILPGIGLTEKILLATWVGGCDVGDGRSNPAYMPRGINVAPA